MYFVPFACLNLVGKHLTVLAAALSAVSAFYAECLSKKIQFNAHIWTKSKFLGMSIGVHNIGQGKPPRLDPMQSPECQLANDLPAAGCVSCLEHDEHYILTFPNGYGRFVPPLCSVLTVENTPYVLPT